MIGRGMMRCAWGVLLGMAWLGWPAVGEDARAGVAKKILEQYKDAIVWVSAVAKTTQSGLGTKFGHGQEQKVEALGTIMDPSGLTVVPYSQLDRSSLFVSMEFDGKKIEMKTELSEVKIRLSDGTEVPGKLVLKDQDLDLAFIAPEKGEGKEGLPEKFPYLPLQDAGKAGILDPLFVLARLAKNLDYQPALFFTEVSSVIRKPRTFYFAMVLSHGSPVFTAEGKVLGITVTRREARMGASMNLLNFMPVVLPASDVAEIAQQALRPKEEEKKP